MWFAKKLDSRLISEQVDQLHLFFVLTGELNVEVDGVLHAVRAGTGIEVPPETAHQVLSLTGAGVDFLVISQPSTRGDREPVGPAPAPSTEPL